MALDPQELLGATDDISKKSGYHHGDLRNAVTNACAHIIAQKRSLDFQLKDVAKVVGTSVPALYRHFQGKQSLIVETAVEGFERQKAFRDFALSKADDSPLARLFAIGFAYVQFARECPGYFLLMKTMETEEILSSERYRKQRLDTIAIIRTNIISCIDEGLMEKRPVEIIIASLQSTAFGLAHIYLSQLLESMAPSFKDDPLLPTDIYKLNIGSLLTPKGLEHSKNVTADPFLNHEN